jgi:hypothetical protein
VIVVVAVDIGIADVDCGEDASLEEGLVDLALLEEVVDCQTLKHGGLLFSLGIDLVNGKVGDLRRLLE